MATGKERCAGQRQARTARANHGSCKRHACSVPSPPCPPSPSLPPSAPPTPRARTLARAYLAPRPAPRGKGPARWGHVPCTRPPDQQHPGTRRNTTCHAPLRCTLGPWPRGARGAGPQTQGAQQQRTRRRPLAATPCALANPGHNVGLPVSKPGPALGQNLTQHVGFQPTAGPKCVAKRRAQTWCH